MGKTVSGKLEITADWEPLAEGEPEERACFASLGILFDRISLTEAHDTYVKRVRPAPLLSGYHLAEWLAWHWWRLRWEPRSRAENWNFAHRLPTIGEGYVWPNITIFTDGARTALLTKPTSERPNTPFRYISDVAAVVPAAEFEGAVDRFIEQIRGQLRAEKVANTNLDLIWDEVREERADAKKKEFRKIEALLGFDPDGASEKVVQTILSDARKVGSGSMEEIAADAAQGGEPLTVRTLETLAKKSGFDASPANAVRIPEKTEIPEAAQTPAWKLGSILAGILRTQEDLGNAPIPNKKLAEFAAVETKAIEDNLVGGTISFAIDTSPRDGRVVLRSKWKEGRRFELARIIADRVSNLAEGRLFPATRSNTYRQKMQRSFAAEFLSPFGAVEKMLAGDYSMENQSDVAEHFKVSELTIRTLLVNHRRMEREELDEEFDTVSTT